MCPQRKSSGDTSAAVSNKAAEIEQWMNVQHELATAVMWILPMPEATFTTPIHTSRRASDSSNHPCYHSSLSH